MLKQKQKSELKAFWSELTRRGVELRKDFAPKFSKKKKRLSCRVCGNASNNDLVRTKEMFLGSRHVFEYVLCHKCRSLSITNIPENISDYYDRYYTVGAPQHSGESAFRKQARRLILGKGSKPLKRLAEKFLIRQDDFPIKAIADCNLSYDAKILDVGCGPGALISELEEAGYNNVVGIDPFLDETQALYSNKVHKKSLFEVDDKFDLIMFHHSFEHMENPGEVLKQANRLLNKEGVCLIRMPSVDSYGFKAFKESWSGIHAPFHYVLPSQEGMSNLCLSSGFKIASVYGEQMPEFLMYSQNNMMDVADFEPEGLRTFLGYNALKKRLPPLYTKAELKFWKKKAKTIEKHSLADWIVYCLEKNS